MMVGKWVTAGGRQLFLCLLVGRTAEGWWAPRVRRLRRWCRGAGPPCAACEGHRWLGRGLCSRGRQQPSWCVQGYWALCFHKAAPWQPSGTGGPTAPHLPLLLHAPSAGLV